MLFLHDTALVTMSHRLFNPASPEAELTPDTSHGQDARPAGGQEFPRPQFVEITAVISATGRKQPTPKQIITRQCRDRIGRRDSEARADCATIHQLVGQAPFNEGRLDQLCVRTTTTEDHRAVIFCVVVEYGLGSACRSRKWNL